MTKIHKIRRKPTPIMNIKPITLIITKIAQIFPNPKLINLHTTHPKTKDYLVLDISILTKQLTR